MKKAILVTLVALFLAPNVCLCAQKGQDNKKEPPVFQVGVKNMIGGPIFLGAADIPGGETSQKFMYQLSIQIGSPRFSWAKLEFGAMFYPSAVSANLIFGVIKVKNLTIHLLDPGIIYWPEKRQLLVNRVERDFDVVFGLGADYQIKDWLTAGFAWRWFLPNPGVIRHYGNFSRLIYREVAGGVLCLSVVILFSCG